jgi:hypothetical protein
MDLPCHRQRISASGNAAAMRYTHDEPEVLAITVGDQDGRYLDLDDLAFFSAGGRGE